MASDALHGQTLDWSRVASLVAHELRAPAGVISGYLSMMKDPAFPAPERARALAQIERATSRVTVLARQASELGHWLAPEGVPSERTTVDAWVDRTLQSQDIKTPVDVDITPEIGSLELVVYSAEALAHALASLIAATARETGDEPLVVEIRAPDADTLSVRIGPPPDGASAADRSSETHEPVSIQRGGLGLSLVLAITVLTAHRASIWEASRRQVVGFELPTKAEK